MNEIEATVLNPKSNIRNLLGEIANQPQFLMEADVSVNKDDAVTRFQRLALAALLEYIHENGTNHPVTAFDVENLIRPYPSAFKCWKENHGARYLAGTIKTTKHNNPEYDYRMVKKYHYLRIYKNEGMDITGLLNYKSNNFDNILARFRKMSIDDVVDYFSNKTDRIKKSWQDTNNDVQSFEIGDGIREHLNSLFKSTQLGYPFQNKFYNQLFGGMRRSKYMIRSTVTGGGKTRQALKDFCNVAFSSFYDPYKKRWVKTGSSYPALFISTELNKDELQNIVLAYLTGIDSKDITFGKFRNHPKQVALLKQALPIIENANFYFEYVEDFNSSDIESLIDKYARQYHVRYVDFDYIQDSPRLMQELKKSYGSGLRSDQALVYLSKELKKLAEKYQIFVMTATQVNGFYADDDKEKSRTEYTLRGGKSIADKADYGIITSRFTKADKNAFTRNKDLNEVHPNYGHHVYKNRAGQKNIIIWTTFNYGNLREKPLVITDYNYNVIPMKTFKPLDIDYK